MLIHMFPFFLIISYYFLWMFSDLPAQSILRDRDVQVPAAVALKNAADPAVAERLAELLASVESQPWRSWDQATSCYLLSPIVCLQRRSARAFVVLEQFWCPCYSWTAQAEPSQQTRQVAAAEARAREAADERAKAT